MKVDTKAKGRRVARRSRLLWTAMTALAFTLAPPVLADTAAPIRVVTAMTMQSPLPPGSEGSDELIVMLCRRGIEPGQAMQELPQELPLLCLVTHTDAQALQMGPARFQELLDRAADSGQLSVMLLQPQ